MTARTRSKKINSFCDYCKKPIEFYRRYLKLKHHFCNRKCCDLFRNKKIFLHCFQCKKIIYKIPSSLKHSKTKHYFCSKYCKDKWMKSYCGEKHPNWKSKKKKCKICSKYFFRSPSHIKKLSFCSNKCHGKWLKIKYKGSGSPSWTGGPEVIKCVKCKKKIYRNKAEIKKASLHFCNLKCRNDYMRGSRSPHWRNGISKLPYSFEFNDKLKEEIRFRDKYNCQLCSVTEEEHIIIWGEVLSVHHIDYNKKNCKKSNLITLCKQCNSRVNFNRKYWVDFLRKIIERKLYNNVNLSALG